MQNVKQNVDELTSEFPVKEDHEGAVRGMFTLFYTYRFNLTDALLSGKLTFYDLFKLHSIPSHEKLTVSSVESMLDLALKREIYASGVQMMSYLLLALNDLKLNNKTMKRLQKKKHTLIKLNNGYLQKTHKILCKMIKHFAIHSNHLSLP